MDERFYVPYSAAIEASKEVDLDIGEENSALDIECIAFFAKHNLSVEDLVLVDDNQEDTRLNKYIDEMEHGATVESHRNDMYNALECFTDPFPFVLGSDYGAGWYIIPKVKADEIIKGF